MSDDTVHSRKARLSGSQRVVSVIALMLHCEQEEAIAMSIEISQENQARLAAEARRLGISEDALLARFLSEHAALIKPAQSATTLPVWHLGGGGALHRRDIYTDVR
jgi:hypothetical protein